MEQIEVNSRRDLSAAFGEPTRRASSFGREETQGSEAYVSNREAMHDQLDSARRDWATMSAKRQRRLYDRVIHGYKGTREKYEELVVQCQKLDLEELLANEPDETQRRLITAEYWLNEQNLLRQETKNTVEGKKTWKFAHAFSEFLNSGSTRMRIIKGVALGFGVGIAGSMLGGVLGAATIGTGIVAAGRFARGYFARHKGGIDQHNLTADEMLERVGDDVTTDEDFENRLRTESSSIFEKDGKKEQNKQRVAFAWGAGSVAVGAAVGLAIAGGHWGALPSAHAETISHTDASTVETGHHDVSTIANGHSDVSTVETSHHDVKTVAPHGHADASTVETGHHDAATVKVASHHDVSTVADGHHDTSTVENSHHDASTISGGESLKPGEFMVEHGSGLTREIHQYAQQLGYKNISAEDSYRIYQIILQEHGKNGIINVHGISHDTYLQGHDVRISAPGEANWRSGVSEDLQKLFTAHEHGHKLSLNVLNGHNDVSSVGGADLPNATAADIAHSPHMDVPSVGNPNLPNASAADIAHSGVHTDVMTTSSADAPNATAADIARSHSGTVDVRHSVVAEAEQIIRKAGNPVNIISHGEGWNQTFVELNRAGIHIAPENHVALLRTVGPELAKLQYDNNLPVAYFDKIAGEWRMNMSPDGRLLPAAVRLIAKYSTRNGYELAA